MTDDQIAKKILDLLASRDDQRSICPSEVARIVADEDEWRQWMPHVRKVGTRLAQKGLIRITQGSKTVPPTEEPKGPIRYRRGATYDTAWNADE